ncbi:hypothetical protein N7478_002158 [Penicillium angulare]|uniref:uncharacterized protein n=1 Tax=Penicillium angulare TaxID=116970 RepID=UPI002542650B|nr:uncharacterized protein N7478_002158 [Penicillium angulare]KAJ5289128.1 hypothetical protein N7478_002158 [Penicillium angulare]
MRFQASLAALFASSAFASTVLLHSLDGTNCVVTVENFAGWSGTSSPIGIYHADTNSCSDIGTDTSSSAYPVAVAGPAGASNMPPGIFLYYSPYGGAGTGTFVVDPADNDSAWTIIDINTVGTTQDITWSNSGLPSGL